MPKTTKKAAPKKSASSETSGNATFLENANIVHALAYFPYFIGAIAMFFLGKTDKKALLHHVKYSLILAFAAFVLFVILNGFFANVVNIAYICFSVYLAYKAYNGEEVNVEILDKVEEEFNKRMKK